MLATAVASLASEKMAMDWMTPSIEAIEELFVPK
jgi:hypothetical protein